MNVRVDTTRCYDFPFGRNDVRSGADFDGDARLYIWVTRLADGCDTAFFNANIRLVDTGVVDDQRIRHHTVHHLIGGAL